MRIHFELKYGVDTLDQARKLAYEEVAKFMGIDESAAPGAVDIELKVSIPDPEKDSGITGHFIVIAFGNIKNSIAKPF